MRVRFTPSARARFLEALACIRRDDPAAAARFRRKAEKALRRLESFPPSGRVVPEFPELPFHEVVVSPHRFFCRVEGKTVWVVAVRHGAQVPDLGKER